MKSQHENPKFGHITDVLLGNDVKIEYSIVEVDDFLQRVIFTHSFELNMPDFTL